MGLGLWPDARVQYHVVGDLVIRGYRESETGYAAVGDLPVTQRVNVLSKHGVVTHCETTAASEDVQLREALSQMDRELVGQRYDGMGLLQAEDRRIAEVVQWLRQSV